MLEQIKDRKREIAVRLEKNQKTLKLLTAQSYMLKGANVVLDQLLETETPETERDERKS